MESNNQILVSVVTVTYNHESYIENAIRGVLMQNCDFDIEFIIANDASKDKTHEVISNVLEKNKDNHNIQLRYFNHSENKGLIDNFIWAVKKAKGKYIAFCEGDDYWIDPTKLQKQVDTLKTYNELAMCTHEVYNQSTNVENNFRRLVSIFKYDIELYGINRVFFLTKKLIFNTKEFWKLKRVHDKPKRKKISYLEDFKFNKNYISFCSILIKRKVIISFFKTYYATDAAHQLTVLIGAIGGGIIHLYEVMAVKCDQESSVTKDEERKKRIKKINADPNRNQIIKRYKALLEFAKNESEVKTLQYLIEKEIKKIAKY